MNPEPATKEKRKRSRIACATCRLRKVRCSVEDGSPCYNCRADGVTCCIPEHRRKRPRRRPIGLSPNAQDFGHGLGISHCTDRQSRQSLSPKGISDSRTLDESPNFSIAGSKLSQLPPTPAPSVAAGNRSYPRSKGASNLDCPLPVRHPPNSNCTGESGESDEQADMWFNTSSEQEFGECEVTSPSCKEALGSEFGECSDLDQSQSQFQALEKAPRMGAEEHNSEFQNLLGLANNLTKLAYNLSLLQRSCQTSHTRCECQELATQSLHPTSCDHGIYSTQKFQKSKCDAPDLHSSLVSPFDTSKSSPGVF